MSNFEDLQRKWLQGKEDIGNTPKVINEVLSLVKAKKKSTVRFQYGNIMVLLITLLGISAFFYYTAPVKEVLSRIGVGLMIGGLLLRIAIELMSIVKSKKMVVIESVLKATERAITYYNFRKRIHGPITITIITLYTIGFFMITPEFSLYFTTWQMVLIDASYIVAAAIFIPIIHRSIKQEVHTLLEIIELRKKIVHESF